MWIVSQENSYLKKYWELIIGFTNVQVTGDFDKGSFCRMAEEKAKLKLV